jgi:hypothetical protein
VSLNRTAALGVTNLWPEPTPLPNGLSPVPAFDLALMPEPLMPWVRDISERMQAPADFIGVTAMIAAGSLIGRKVVIRPQRFTDWSETPNLWGCIIGRPGAMKSPSMKQALAPLHRLEAEAREEHRQALSDWKAGEMERDLRTDARRNAMKTRLKDDPSANVNDLRCGDDPEPVATRYIANDAGYQALAELLRVNATNGILSFRDELMSLVRALDDEGRVEDRGFYLTAWNGSDSYTSDRIGRGFNLHIPAVTVSLLGSTQPGKIRDYVARSISGGAGDDGLIQRFGMMVWPDMDPRWKEVDRQPCGAAKRQAFAVFEKLARMTPESVGASVDESHPERAFVRLDPAAQDEFSAWWGTLERRLRSDDLHPAMESHLAKYRKLVPALALIHHLASGGYGSVSHASLLAACAWSEYLEAHAARVYGAAIDDSANGAKTILQRIKKGDLESPFTVRDVHKKGWAGLSDREAVAAACDRLEAHNYLRLKEVDTGGRPSLVATVNPRISPRAARQQEVTIPC